MRLPLRTLPVVALLTVISAAPLSAQQGTRLLRQPSVSATQIAFAYAGDIWIVAREGGEARRLTSYPGVESNPAFSPDGQWVAFSGEYAGNPDGYVVSVQGGSPLFDLDGKWAVENEGIPPDIEVEQTPRQVLLGHDPQLERAVAEALRLLQVPPVRLRPEPAPPIRVRRP